MTKKKGFLGMLVVALVFGLIMTSCPMDTEDNSGNTGNEGNNTGINKKNITVYMQKPSNWSQLYAYVWDDSETEYSESSPGTLLTSEGNGYYSFQANDVEYGYINARFSDGGSYSSIDILGVDTDTYYKDSGTYSADSSKTLLLAGTTASISTPRFQASEVTDSTITLTWDPIPGVDGYILYDEWVDYDDNEEEIPDSEYWHFQKAFVPSERSIYDDNYGQYLDPEAVYTWKLVAIKYKDGANLSSLDSKDPDYISEDDYSPFYNVVHDFGELEVETDESSLTAPTNLRVVSTSPNSVALSWNAVADADYYMVWWWNDGSDGREEDWYYIEEAYKTTYLDNDEEFISPNSTYKYLVVAHNERTYSKDSSEVTATTPAASSYSMLSSVRADISRAVVTPSAPSTVGAAPKAGAANTIEVAWYAASNATKYEIALFTSASGGTPKSGTTKTVSGNYYGRVSYTYKSVPASPGVYYPGVRSVNGSKKSAWAICPYSVSPFPKVSLQSAKSKISGSTKTITIMMNASWKPGASYGYKVTVAYQDTGYIVSNWNEKRFDNSNTISISGLDKKYKYKVYITPFASGSFNGATLIKEKL